jgi:hypothetical protein
MFVFSTLCFDNLVGVCANAKPDGSRQIPCVSSKLIYKSGLCSFLSFFSFLLLLISLSFFIPFVTFSFIVLLPLPSATLLLLPTTTFLFLLPSLFFLLFPIILLLLIILCKRRRIHGRAQEAA